MSDAYLGADRLPGLVAGEQRLGLLASLGKQKTPDAIRPQGFSPPRAKRSREHGRL